MIRIGWVSSPAARAVNGPESMNGLTGAPRRTRKLAVVVLSRAGSVGTFTEYSPGSASIPSADAP